jgi:hypothetical protein
MKAYQTAADPWVDQGKDGETNIHEEKIIILLIIIRDKYGKSRFDMESI